METMRLSGRHVSVDAPIVSDDTTSMLDVMVNYDAPRADQNLISESLSREIERSLATLSEKERDIINLYFGIGVNHSWTLEEIGVHFDLTR